MNWVSCFFFCSLTFFSTSTLGTKIEYVYVNVKVYKLILFPSGLQNKIIKLINIFLPHPRKRVKISAARDKVKKYD